MWNFDLGMVTVGVLIHSLMHSALGVVYLVTVLMWNFLGIMIFLIHGLIVENSALGMV